ncbi:MAG: hypothetical protein IKX25_07090 [Bacteroidales bacterium]|nr:hypothetical protein [Bacteroidales bacterium]
MNSFEHWDKEFRAQNLFAFNNNANGLLWLKVRAVCRSKQIKQFLEDNNLILKSTKISERNAELFQLLEKLDDSMDRLDKYLSEKNHEWYKAMGVDEAKLKEDLYKVQHYAWGGDQNNSLDKHLVSRYVKTISEYDCLVSRRGEIAENAWNYVQTSWYNNWTSYLIESLFKRHSNVISAVGEIKSVDFFIKGFPIDLKVTFFPNQYMDEKLRIKLGKNVLSWLKAKGKEYGLSVDANDSEAQQIYTLTEKLSELGHEEVIKVLNDTRSQVVQEAQDNPVDLMKWLYEHQGEMRFGAENRLFVILADSTDISQSWKMKRAFSLIEPKVQKYLDNFSNQSLKHIDFKFNKLRYQSLADVLFVVK